MASLQLFLNKHPTCFEKGGDRGRRGGAFGVVCGHRHQACYTGLDCETCVVGTDIVGGAFFCLIVIYMHQISQHRPSGLRIIQRLQGQKDGLCIFCSGTTLRKAFACVNCCLLNKQTWSISSVAECFSLQCFPLATGFLHQNKLCRKVVMALFPQPLHLYLSFFLH